MVHLMFQQVGSISLGNPRQRARADPPWRAERRSLCARLQFQAFQLEGSILDTEELTVRYFDAPQASQNNLSRSFKYSLSRGDVGEAVFSGS